MHPNKKVAFYTLGCKLNFSETSSIAKSFNEQGFATVDFSDHADCYVINTCSVTDNADKKCRNIVRKALRTNPTGFVIVVGCYAQLKPEEIKSIEGVDLVLGAEEKFNALDHIGSLDKNESGIALYDKIGKVKEFFPSFSSGDRTRSFLKIQDGCDYFCAFCTIPLARGRSRSNTVKETIKTAKEVALTEAKEVVITGVNIGDFGKGTAETFYDLVKELDQIEGIDRFRISSIEPNLLSDEIIDYVSTSKRFVPHFHIPLQSGSDNLLVAMRRKYLSDLYRNRVGLIKKLMPDACIGVDVIIGFPGETDQEFQTTYDFLIELDVSYLHVFTYSERDNTTAVRLDDVVPMETRNKRSKMLRILSAKKKRKFYESQIGTEHTVLWEATNEEGFMTGFTENYVKVQTPFDAAKVNKTEKVFLDKIDGNGNVLVTILEPITA
ncbi:tRNA (N(6)-L-threonylcarbamoyladenosine(37)-C(2))-methylthiotransferase MtaB [Salibacteraceae bacterium]|nr:tRNA (N(6)-L-threonylcarbamoyladenosine(37)-C(2))-methylthiotransferase MtaB [Crocinitomicaceae bacterium]MDA7730363.1 tRNA (N(6)-L-threonylcarbamoyladenosine(37)-C(2))-methylthiotransferase MtaB [Salibacteraceae bacterium]MDC1204062.1 tRNA (N(6)-L-threonylcarbamoyladenosine(37)-C(2))-methylthiotransferase MtaB [Salibacteraceae bacterium]|tara:strand:- start:101540 stop:102853 length:1314 start_codon:yes stop_codon:yes gene_type:complete